MLLPCTHTPCARTSRSAFCMVPLAACTVLLPARAAPHLNEVHPLP